MNIKKGDNILIISGKDKGKKGKVENVLPKENKLIAIGINKVKKQVKPSRGNPQGGIIDSYLPFNRSKAMIICPRCDRPTRVGCKISESGKERICRQCKESLEQENV